MVINIYEKLLKYSLTILFLTIYILSYAQTTWFISATGNNLNSGLTPADAFATVNKAISVSSCGDSVYILFGVYHEKMNAYKICPDNQRIIIQGDTSARPLFIGDSAAANKYAISASGQSFTFRHLELTSPFPDICSQSNMVVVGSGNNMRFIDLIIRNAGYDGIKTTSDCSTSTWADNWEVINCQIINNGLGCPSSVQNGDGIDFTECHNCRIMGSNIMNNKGHQVQIKLESRNVTVEDCRIEGRLLFQIGIKGSTPQCDTNALNADSVFIRHNIIIAKGDTSEFIFKLSDVSHLVIENNTIIKDSISLANVGFICFGGCAGSSSWAYTPKAPVIIRNNIFASMTSTEFYAGVGTTYYDPFGSTAANVTGNYNLFYDVNGEYSVPPDGGASSLVADPLFCNYPFTFELGDGSPCINAGDPGSQPDPDFSRNDIGAKYHHTPCTTEVSDNSMPDGIFAVFPNPATENITISVPANTVVNSQLQIYNTLGMLIKEAGTTQTTLLSIADLPGGFYLIQLKNNSCRRQIFIKQ